MTFLCRIGETDAEAQQRLQGWDSFLETEAADKADKAAKVKSDADAATAATSSSAPIVAAPVEKAPVDSDAESGADTEGEEETD